MNVRHSTENDFERIMEIYKYARAFMVSQGNPNQWEAKNWPPAWLIHEDIAGGRSYVCEEAGRVVGTFYMDYGKDIDPTYLEIEGGKWLDDSAYGVVHRIAADGSVKGVGTFCLNWAYEQCGHLRIDTHGDNIVMQTLLDKLGFQKCGIIYVKEDNYPRFAYEKI